MGSRAGRRLHKSLPICDSSKQPLASSRAPPFTPRRAVDPRGRVGYFYDARIDQVLSESSNEFQSITQTVESSVNCTMVQKTSDETPNLMRTQNIHEELRLSITLGLTAAEGIGALFNETDPIDRYSRFLNCGYLHQREYLTDNQLENLCFKKREIETHAGTHLIILVNYGIDAVILLQLPRDDQIVPEIDQLLQNLCNDIRANKSAMTNHEIQLLSSIRRTTVFSNDPLLAKCKTLTDFCRTIEIILQDIHHVYKPYNYNLCPIDHLFLTKKPTPRFHHLHYRTLLACESYLIDMKVKMGRINTLLRMFFETLTMHCHITYEKMCGNCFALAKRGELTSSRLSQIIIDNREKGFGTEIFFRLSDNQEYEEFQREVNKSYRTMCNLRWKVPFIEQLLKSGFHYVDTVKYDFQSNESEHNINRRLLEGEQNIIILCSNDELFRAKQDQWKRLGEQLKKQIKETSSLKVVYADFTYSEYKLHDFKLFRSNPTDSENTSSEPTSISEELARNVAEDDYINILLLGQSGAGKSTFINAFANYLQFESFDDASRHEPIVLLPISFMLTSGNNFDEHHIKYDGLDPSSTEDFEAVGSSVTQFSKSYLMKITRGPFRGKKLRLIDTPGFSDTRGLDQDECNLHGILSFINNLQHLDAICLVMKPNISRSDIVFSSFIRQIFDVLGDRVRDHVMFCFTNTRSTFYGRGDTSPVLQEILRSLPGEPIPFDKSNVFCFDSESFQYLVARKKQVSFDRDETATYRNSWDRSSTESTDFLTKIIQKTTKYNLQEEHKSIQRTRLKILVLLRPMFESLRNLLQNKVLSDSGVKERIILRATSLEEPLLISRQEGRNLQKCGRFSMKEEVLTKAKGRVNLRDVAFHQLDYSCENSVAGRSDEDESLRKLLKVLASSSMLLQSTGTETEDIVMMEFRRILEDERWIVENQRGQEKWNKMMMEYWKRSMELYLKYQDRDKYGESYSLDAIEQSLSVIMEEKNMKVQWSAINETQRNIFQKNQFKFDH